jgi:hypothetical protein
MGFVEGDGPRSAARQRNQIVDTKGAVKLPTGPVIRGEYRNGRFPNGIGRQAGTRRRHEDYQACQT